MSLYKLSSILLFIAATYANPAPDEAKAKAYLEGLESRYSQACTKQSVASWDYLVNVTDHNEKVNNDESNAFEAYAGKVQMEIIDQFPKWKDFKDEDLKRQFQFLSIRGPAKMPKEKVDKMNEMESQMKSAYSSAKVCGFKDKTKCDYRLDPELYTIMKTSTDYEELSYYWTAWHDKMSKEVTPDTYKKFVGLMNDYGVANGFKDVGDYWTVFYHDGSPGYTSEKFKADMVQVWEDLRPYYTKLHAYVRMKLRKSNPVYEKLISKNGYLPACVMGDMWSQDWGSLAATTKPYMNAKSLDATEALVAMGYTPLKVFQAADDFFAGLGLKKMTDKFWSLSVLERPEGREIVCHPSGHDFCEGKGSTDYRIKQCTKITMGEFITAHHEMGHIEYYMQYQDQPYVYRTGANPGFHEAIGDALALAVMTPDHLQCKLGLDMKLPIDCNKDASAAKPVYNITEMDYNFLYSMALSKFAFFPFAISMDMWRFDVFSGKVKKADYNKHWWDLRKKNQGIVPPTPRADDGFDPAAKFHIPANVEYIRYFFSHVVQFQFYEAMCKLAKEYDPNDPNTKPLFACDFTGNKEAGELFGKMMAMGSSKPWPEILKVLIGGTGELSMKPLLNYYKPLFELFDKELAAAGETACFGEKC